MQNQVFLDAIKNLINLIQFIQDNDLGNNQILGPMSQKLIKVIDEIDQQAKQLFQQKQGWKVQILDNRDQGLVQEQPFQQKEAQKQQQQQQQQQKQKLQSEYQFELLKTEYSLQLEKNLLLQSNRKELEDQSMQQYQNSQKKLTLKQQIQQQDQPQQQIQQQQQYQQTNQGSSVVFYPIKQPQSYRQNQNKETKPKTQQNEDSEEVNKNLYLDKLKIKYNKLLSLTHGEIIDEKQFSKLNQQNTCSICLSSIFYSDNQKDIIQICCNHLFHCDCLDSCIKNDSLKCPICQKIYGIITGDQPVGTICWKIINSKCEGYDCDTIAIEYFFDSGVGNNGQSYTGTHRTAYLPNNSEGNKYLTLLKKCFNQRLTFTIGTSQTTGKTNQVVWNGIHHKTSLSGGPTSFGYPDNTYFKRLEMELSAKGIN